MAREVRKFKGNVDRYEQVDIWWIISVSISVCLLVHPVYLPPVPGQIQQWVDGSFTDREQWW